MPRPLRFRPHTALVWRDPSTVQIGVERAYVVLHAVSAFDEQFVWAIANGLGDGGVGAILAQIGGERAEADRLVARLEPALDPRPTHAVPAFSVLLHGVGPIADDVGRLLQAEGLSVRLAADPAWRAPAPGSPLVGVLVGGLALDPVIASSWSRDDLPHLLVRTGDRSVRIGPLVIPGRSACSRCLHLAAGDVDRAWPAIAGQLSVRPVVSPRPLVVRESATTTVRRLIDSTAAIASPLRAEPDRVSRITRIDLETGSVTQGRARPHPDCGCAVLPGTCSADARLLGPARSGSTRDGGVPGPG
jgi:bacteriocin biosynthesis cyclodehydratase domain-containing protein